MEFIDQSEYGFNTVVGEKGTQLSGGQVRLTYCVLVRVVDGRHYISVSELRLRGRCSGETTSRFFSWMRSLCIATTLVVIDWMCFMQATSALDTQNEKLIVEALDKFVACYVCLLVSTG